MRKSETKFLLASFLSWRILLFGFIILGSFLFPLQERFLGGNIEDYLKAPWFWSFINFDGEHYLSIAFLGYQPLTHFFFPFYPMVTKIVAELFSKSFVSYAISGIFVSHISFLLALFGIWKLLKMDFKEDIVKLTILLFLVFPTSFYFATFYSSSLFLALVVWSFYFARKQNWLLAGVLGGLSTATRITGLALFPALAVEYFYPQITKHQPLITRENFLKLISLLLIPLGLIIYMIYLKRTTGDPLAFFNTLEIFGQQRSTDLVLLPQVFYRYFFKVLPNINYSYFPLVFSTYLEIVTAIMFLILGIWSFLKLRLSYALYFAAGYLIPPLSGSFSSFPRYVLILFPGFLLLAIYLSKKSKIVKTIVYLALFATLAIATALFTRGYWVS
jgi:Gpi18-like mannosyltransferase